MPRADKVAGSKDNTLCHSSQPWPAPAPVQTLLSLLHSGPSELCAGPQRHQAFQPYPGYTLAYGLVPLARSSL